MNAKTALGTLLAALALGLAHPAAAADPAPPACEEGKIPVNGRCVAACPAEGAFDAASCECTPGSAKVFFGNGAAECKPLVCPRTGQFSEKRDCACAEGSKKRPAGKGSVKCVAAKKA